MRMDPTAEVSARELVNEASERELTEIFRSYGEERYARQIAKRIARAAAAAVRDDGRAGGGDQGCDPDAGAVRRGHPARRVFQALRIAVNDELGALEAALPQRWRCLRRAAGSP